MSLAGWDEELDLSFAPALRLTLDLAMGVEVFFFVSLFPAMEMLFVE